MNSLQPVIASLEAIDATSTTGGTSLHFVEVRVNQYETVIVGNQEGLVHLALQMLRLAQKAMPGAHYHLDEASIADKAETKVVFSYGSAPWA